MIRGVGDMWGGVGDMFRKPEGIGTCPRNAGTKDEEHAGTPCYKDDASPKVPSPKGSERVPG